MPGDKGAVEQPADTHWMEAAVREVCVGPQVGHPHRGVDRGEPAHEDADARPAAVAERRAGTSARTRSRRHRAPGVDRALLGRATTLEIVDDVPPLGDDEHLAAGEIFVALEPLRDLLQSSSVPPSPLLIALMTVTDASVVSLPPLISCDDRRLISPDGIWTTTDDSASTRCRGNENIG